MKTRYKVLCLINYSGDVRLSKLGNSVVRRRLSWLVGSQLSLDVNHGGTSKHSEAP